MMMSRRSALAHMGAGVAGLTGLAATDAFATPTEYVYDPLGRLRRVIFPDGSTVDYTYDASGNRTQVLRVGPGDFNATITITGTGPVNLRALADAAGYSGVRNATITFTLASGVTISGTPGNGGGASAEPGGVGIDTGTWPISAVFPLPAFTIALTLQISGNVYGGGGGGGIGSVGNTARPSSAGGDAIYCRVPITITVNSGAEVKAGGGGGGGGGGWRNTGIATIVSGGSGGGGFPNGLGAANGTTSGGGAGSGGEIGTGAATGHNGGDGGAGANAGGAGVDGNAPSGSSGGGWQSRPSSNGSGPGYAIRKNGNAVPVTNNGTIVGTVG